jgi:ribosomal-protein-alanine N-acetyltransferase
VEVAVRLVTQQDAPRLTQLLVENREFLAPWDPERGEEYFTEETQRRLLADALLRHGQDRALPLVVLADGAVVGRVNVNDIVRGPFLSGHLGYWVARSVTGRGVATAAVTATVELAFGELGLHRLQAGTLVHNHASRRVLSRCGFQLIGLAPRYLQIAGRWQDHLLHQRLAEP